jgi:hypothetical protein
MRTHEIEPTIHAFTALVSCKINTQHTPLVKYNIKNNCINITYQLAYLSTLVRGDFGIKGCPV